MRLEDLPGYNVKRVLAFRMFKIFVVLDQAALIGLKLTGALPWNWWWILTPTWVFCLATLAMSLWMLKILAKIEDEIERETNEAYNNDWKGNLK